MQLRSILVVSLLVLVSMAGCTSLFGDDHQPRTHEFTLEISPGLTRTVPVYTMNDGVTQKEIVAVGFMAPGQSGLAIPNPTIRVTEGDTVILRIINNNPMEHTLHLHGGLIPWEMDGVPYLTQIPIMPGEMFTYVFEDLKAGTYFYHCHVDSAHHIDLGMYGAFIVEERNPTHKVDREFVLMLDEVDHCHVHGGLEPVTGMEQHGEFSEDIHCMQRILMDNLAQNMLASGFLMPLCDLGLPEELADAIGCGEHMMRPPQQSQRTWWPDTHPIYNPTYNTFLINGKSYPDTEPLVVQEGETIRIRLINVGNQPHSMHLHGHKMLVTHRDGYELASPFYVDTLGILPAERYDVIVQMDNPGLWEFHDHIGLNMRNDFHDPGGMMTCLAYDGFRGVDASSFTRALDCHHAAMEILGGHAGHRIGRR